MRFSLFILLSFFFVLKSNSFSQNLSPAPEFSVIVFENIFNAMNDGKVVKPKLVLSDDPREVATFDPRGNEPVIKLGINFIELKKTLVMRLHMYWVMN